MTASNPRPTPSLAPAPRRPAQARLALLAVLMLTPATSACGEGDPGPVDDPRDETFLASGKADAFGVSDGSDRAIAVLAVVNQGDLLLLTTEIGITVRAARAILAFRQGPDGLPGTADDRLLASLTELDALPWIGRGTFARLLAYADLHPPAATVPAPPTEPTPDPTPLGWRESLPAGPVELRSTVVMYMNTSSCSTSGFSVPGGNCSYGHRWTTLSCRLHGERDRWLNIDCGDPVRYAGVRSEDGTFSMTDGSHNGLRIEGRIDPGRVLTITAYRGHGESLNGPTSAELLACDQDCPQPFVGPAWQADLPEDGQGANGSTRVEPAGDFGELTLSVNLVYCGARSWKIYVRTDRTLAAAGYIEDSGEFDLRGTRNDFQFSQGLYVKGRVLGGGRVLLERLDFYEGLHPASHAEAQGLAIALEPGQRSGECSDY